MKLSQICTLKQWKTISKNQLVNDGYPVYGANGIIGYSNEFNHETPTLMIGCRGTCGEIHLSEGKAYINGNAMCLDNLSSEFDINYVKYFLEHYDFSKIITGTAQPQITQQGLDKVQISKIPLEEQKLIASKITNIKELTSIETNAIRNLDSLIKSRFIEMFGDCTFNSLSFKSACIGENCFVTKLAGFEYTNYIHYQKTGDVIMVKAQNVKDGKLNNRDLSYISLETSNSLPRSQLKENDIVMTYVGANIGDVAVIDGNAKYHLAPNVALIRPNNNNVNSIFLVYELMSMREYILNNSINTAKGALSMERIRNLKIVIPPIELQNEFASLVEQVDKLKFNCQQRIKLYQELLDKKMDEYFG